MEGVSCEIGFFEKYKDEYIKRKFLLATSETVEDALSKLPEPPAALREAGDVVRKRRGQITLRVIAA
jgi:hypothetical protein